MENRPGSNQTDVTRLVTLDRLVSARIPTAAAEFQLYYYHNTYDYKEHLALVLNPDVDGKGGLDWSGATLVRIHSECFTGDVLGSQRCDCGPQLQQAMLAIAAAGKGVIIYLRQEGRGIGLLDKLRAYNLQDEGLDTVDANLVLGHQADARDYTVAARMLAEIGVQQVRLLTNNPAKVEALRAHGWPGIERVPLPGQIHAENAVYLATKVSRMRHLLNLSELNGVQQFSPDLTRAMLPDRLPERPFVTLTYAQGLDGAITRQRGTPLPLSGAASMLMTHQLRANHDAILVGRNTVAADDPRLTVRLISGQDPQPIVLDSKLMLPPQSRLLQDAGRPLWIAATTPVNSQRRAALQSRQAQIIELPADGQGRVSLPHLLPALFARGIYSLMVEGGAAVITSFLQAGLVDRLILTIAPQIVGGLTAVGPLSPRIMPRLKQLQTQQLGDDLIVFGDVIFADNQAD